jgi:hypothetical protein
MIRFYAAFAMLAGAVLAAVLLTVVPRAGGAGECTTTVSSLAAAASAVDAAPAGATICLSDGTYGELTLDADKSNPGVTVRAEHPGKATIAGAALTGSHLTIAQFRIAGTFNPRPGSTGMTADHNLFVGGNYFGVMAADTTTTTVNDVSITNNRFDGRFNEDTIRANRYHDADGDGAGLLIEGNEFTGNVEYGGHNDVFQSVWVGDHLVFRRNYLHDFGGQGFFVKDQASAIDGLVVEDNLIVRQNRPCDPTSLCPTWQLSPFQIFGPARNVSIRHNTVWPGDSGGSEWLRGAGWTGPTVFSDNVMANLNSDATALTTGYSGSNNTRCGGIGFPDTGVATDCNPAFIDAANGDYREASGRGVTWRLADQQFGPGDGGGGGTTPPPGDETPPSTTISSGPSGSTTSTNATFAFASNEAGSTFECKLDSGSFASCTSPKTYNGLATGQHSFSVRATDAAGNVDDSPATATWTIAGQPGDSAPDTTITSGPSGPTNDATPAFAFQSSESGSTFECRVDDGAWAACSSPWTTAALADGDHSVGVRATDADDNTDGSPAARTFTVDTKAPHTAIGSAPSGTSDSATATIAFTVDEWGSTSECRLDDGAWVACTSPYAITGLGDGAHTVVVRSRDAAGNVESPGASASWTVALPGGGGPGTPGGTPPTVDLSVATGGRALALTATADDDNGVDHVEFWVDGRRVDTDGAAPYVARVYTRGLSSGSHTVSVRAFDAAGQAASSARTVRLSDSSYGRRWSIGSTELTSDDNGNGAIHLSGRTSADGASVGLARCDDADGDVVDRFDMDADARGRLDLVYAGKGLCVVELRSRWG